MEGSTEGNTNLRAASFTYYLDTAKENSLHKTSPTKFVFNVPTPIQDPPPFTFPQAPRKNDEISIFGAEKYFSMKVDYQMGMIKSKKEGPVNLTRSCSNPGSRTPSLRSESSTWTSQTALLPFLHRNGSQIKQKKASGRRIFSGFGCKQPCCNRKDVDVSYYGPKPARTGSERSNSFNVKKLKEEEKEEKVANIEPPRASIEVFGSKTALKGDVAKNMERKLSILTWDAIPKAQNLVISTIESSTVFDDMASEVSSDLFEIENLSGSKHTSVCTSPVSHYTPSEASIQWSVVTGSAADYSASNCHDEKSVRVTAGDVAMSKTNGNETNRRLGKIRNVGLLGCNSLKGADVAGNVLCKANEKGKHEGLDLSVLLGKSQTNLKHG